MSFMDHAIAMISPKRAYEREMWRQAWEEQRSYDAGNNDRLNANWRAINDSAEATDRYCRDSVRARVRDLERNSDLMNSVISPFKRNVFGEGYTLQSKASDETIAAKLEEIWKEWCKKRNCDVTGTQSFNQMMRMAVLRKKVDGGILFLKRYEDGGILPFKLQAIEVDELDLSQIASKKHGNKVVGGIEINSHNRPEGYWIRQYSLDGFSPQQAVYIEANDVVFYFTKTRPSQIREMSDMAPTVSRIRDANEFMVAVSVKERIAACLSVFIKRAFPTLGAGRVQTDGKRMISYEGKTITPGMIREMNPGDEAQIVTPAGQAGDASDYIKLQQRLMGAGQGLSYEATSRDMSQTNYSSARQGGIEDGLTFVEEVELLEEAMDEIYETFVISAVLNGLIEIRDFWSNKRQYLAHEWIKTPKRWIDPLKEANANRVALETGQKTFQQIAGENGKDWKEQLNEMAEAVNYGKSIGLDLGGIIFGNYEQEQSGTGSKKPESE